VALHAQNKKTFIHIKENSVSRLDFLSLIKILGFTTLGYIRSKTILISYASANPSPRESYMWSIYQPSYQQCQIHQQSHISSFMCHARCINISQLNNMEIES